tara:strand:+ start:203 stop:562 length:360 start_codon:yes stop_codon:yes gene_type:complete
MIKDKAKRVEDILRKYPQSRDNDLDLIARYWYLEMRESDMNDDQIKAFCQLVKSGLISLPDTITRARRKIQEEIPALRGDKYNKRHSATEVVKEEIKEIPEMVGTYKAFEQISLELFGR